MRLSRRMVKPLSFFVVVCLLTIGALGNSVFTPRVFAADADEDLREEALTAVPSVDSACSALNAGTSMAFSITGLEEGELPVEGAVTATISEPEAIEDGTGIDWSKKCVMKEKGSVNVREGAGTDSPVIGKLFEGGAADVIEKGEEWTKIASGSVEGYIANEFLLYGKEAAEMAKEKGTFVATVSENSIRIRKEADGSAGVMGLVGTGERLLASNAEPVNGYVEITYGDKKGYISRDYVNIEFELGVAKTLKEIKAEEAAKAAAAAKEKAKKEGKTLNASIAASADEVSLLAALLMCEAGNQSHECKLGVASVVMNRVRSGRYPNDIYSVIYQAGQFPPASVTGKVGAYLASGYISSDCMAAAQEAISGISNVGSAIGFAHAGSRPGVVIGPIVFF